MTADARQSRRRRAIPGDYTRYTTPPIGEVDAALASLRSLGLNPTVYVDRITATIPAEMTISGGGSRHVVWRWGVLWDDDTDGWYEMGWHPSVMYRAIKVLHRRAIWLALNPNKGAAPL